MGNQKSPGDRACILCGGSDKAPCESCRDHLKALSQEEIGREFREALKAGDKLEARIFRSLLPRHIVAQIATAVQADGNNTSKRIDGKRPVRLARNDQRAN